MSGKYRAIDYEYKKAWKEVLGIARAMYYANESRREELKKELEEARMRRDALEEQGARLPIA